MFSIFADGKSIYDPSVDTYYLFQPSLKLEFGKSGSLEFSVPPTNYYYDKFQQLKTLISVELDGEEIFYGRVFSIERGMNNFKKVICEGDLSFLVDSVQKAEKYNGTTRALFNTIIANHNAMVETYKQFRIGNVTIDNRSIILTGKDEGQDINVGDIDYKQIAINSMADEWNSTYDYIQNCLIDYCGGYLRTRREGGVTFIDYLKNYAATNTEQVIQFSKNLLDLTIEASAEDLFTVLIPIGDDNLTVRSVNKNKDEIVDTEAVKKYGRIVRTHVFSNVNNASTLLENGKRYLAENVNLKPTYEVKAIDIHLLDGNISAIHVGDRVRLKSAPHGISEYLVCTAIEYDFGNPENNTYTFGNPKQTLTQRYKEDKRKTNDSAASAAGAAGSGVAKAAADDAKEKADAIKDEIYDEWINIDPDNPDGIGSLGGLYTLLKDGREVLTQKVGIDFNAKENNISLYALKETAENALGVSTSAKAAVEAGVRDIGGYETAISQMVANYKTEVDGKISEHEATWSVWANEKESVISGKADRFELDTLKGNIKGEYEKDLDAVKEHLSRKVGIDWDAKAGTLDLYTMNEVLNEQGETIQSNSTSITQISNSLQSQIKLEAKYQKKNDKKVASIEAIANANKSEIELKADQVTIDAEITKITGRLDAAEADIESLTAQKITADQIITAIELADKISVKSLTGDSISATKISVRSGSGTYEVATKQYIKDLFASAKYGIGEAVHYHVMTENIQAGTITLGLPTSQGPQTFDIRATKTYRDAVAAAGSAVTSIAIAESDEKPDSGYKRYIPSSKTVMFYRKATATFEKADAEPYVQDSIYVSVNISDIYTQIVQELNESQATAIQEAVDAVKITSLGRDTSRSVEFPVSGQTHFITIPIKATASNGADSNDDLSDQNRVVTASVQSVYTDGRQSVAFDPQNPIIKSSNTYTSGEHYNGDTAGTTTIYVKAKIDNNKESREVEFTTSKTAFNSGKAVGKSEAEKDIKVVSCTLTPVANSFNSTTKLMKVKANVPLTSGKNTYTNDSLTLDVSQAWNAVKAQPPTRDTAVAIGSRYNQNTKVYDLTARVTGTASNGTTAFADLVFDGSGVYDQGVTAGNTAASNNIKVVSCTLTPVANSFNSTTKLMKVKANVPLTSGKNTYTNDSLTLDVSQAWNAVTVSAVDSSNVTYEKPSTNYAYGRYIFTVTGTAENGKTKSVSRSIIPSGAYLEGKNSAGAAADTVSVSSLTLTAQTNTNSFNKSTKQLNVKADVTLSSNKNSYSVIKPVDASLAWNAVTVDTVDTSNVTYEKPSTNYAYGRYTFTVTGTAENGKTKSVSRSIIPSGAYSQGITKGEKNIKDAIDISSIAVQSYDSSYDVNCTVGKANTYYNSGDTYIRAKLKVLLAPSNVVKYVQVNMHRGKAYSDGQANPSGVDISSIAVQSYDSSYDINCTVGKANTYYNSGDTYIRGKLKILLAPTNTVKYVRVNMHAGKAYEDGSSNGDGATVQSVSSLSTGGGVAIDKEIRFSKSKTYYESPYVVGYLKVDLSNGSSSTICVYMHGGTAIDNAGSSGLTPEDLTNSYNQGYAQGAHDGSPMVVTGSTYIGGQTFYIVKKMNGVVVNVPYNPNA